MKGIKLKAGARGCDSPLTLWMARFVLPCLALVLLTIPCLAQTDSLAERIPANAWLYLHWHGTASLAGVRDTNSVLRLLRDPSVAALPGKVITYAQSQARKSQTGTANEFTQQDADDLVSLLQNPAVFGVLNNSADTAAAKSTGTFLIYDATGKQELLERFRKRRASASQAMPGDISIVIARVPVTKVVSRGNTSYEAETGKYFVRTDSLPAMAELLPHLTGGNQAASAIESAPEIPAACRDFPRNSLLDFVALPGKLNLAQITSNPNFNISAFVKALHVDRIQAACGSLRFETTSTRFQYAIRGDTSAGSVLNSMGDNRQDFATLALAPPGASYQCTVFDLASLYSSLKTAFTAAVPPERAGLVTGMDALLAMSWGMAPMDALQLPTGEIASIRVNPSVDPSQKVYALSIRQPDKVASLIRNIFQKSNPAEKQEGDTTYFTLSSTSGMVPGTPPSADATGQNSFTVAVAPTMLVVSKDQALARDAVSRSRSVANPSSSLSGDAGYQKVRRLLPGKLDFLSYTELARFNWEKMARDFQKQLNEQAQQTAKATKKPVVPPMDILSNFDWQAFGRYLHFYLGGSWKDASGISFDSYIQ